MNSIDTQPAASWKRRFRATNLSGQIAPRDLARGMVLSNQSGVAQLYAWNTTSGQLTQLTHTPEGKPNGFLSSDGRFVYYFEDTQGNEIGRYVRVPFAGGQPQNITPGMDPYASLSFNTSRDDRAVGFTTADQHGFRIHTVRQDAQAELQVPQLLFQSRSFSTGPLFSADASCAVVATTEGTSGLNFRCIAFDAVSGTQLATLAEDDGYTVEPDLFSPLAGDLRMLAISNRGGVKRPLLWDIRTGARSDLALGDLVGDVEIMDWSPDGEQVLLLQISQAVHQLYRYDLASATLTQLEHPAGTVFGAFYGPQGEIWANWQSSAHPPQVIALGSGSRVILAAGDVPPSPSWRSVQFPSTGGVIIQGWLAVPDGPGPFPTILETHGGPTFAMTNVYHAGGHAWVDHGFAFLTINYRGSTTFGREFEQSIWGDLGHWEIDDMVAARDFLLREGVADPAQILLTGWSYGGYLTLQALGKRPDLWAGGMAGIAIADWAMQYEDSAETLKGYQVAIFGGTPDEKPDAYAAASPITYAEHVSAPVLVIQGSNDTRCPARPMRKYEQRLRQLGKQIEVEWFEAGHGSYVVEQSIAHQELMLRFAMRILG
ncbi:MAG: prolyl oligopeptidase family serine peptidase [Roseiflexaceae bacterium]|nr:prolyl oligopeptidase family serine peptidase [Roseiflexaceae bacterium]